MASSSKKPLAEKLGIKKDLKIIFINEPVSIYRELGDVSKFNSVKTLKGKFDYVHFFTKEKAELVKFFTVARKFLRKDGALWISWPKKSSKIVSSIDENIIREIGLKKGLVDVKIIAIDSTWSGLKFVYRRNSRK